MTKINPIFLEVLFKYELKNLHKTQQIALDVFKRFLY